MKVNGKDYPISADPACSRGSASEEELPAARANKSLQAARARSKKTRKKKQEARSNSGRPGPSLRALLFGCGAGAVLGQTARFSCRFRKQR